MTNDEKLELVKTILEIDDEDTSEDRLIGAYLHVSEQEIISWRYSYAAERPVSVPQEYEMTQIHAVIAGYSVSGVENQTSHKEGTIARTFKYEDMVAYIRSHVVPIARCY